MQKLLDVVRRLKWLIAFLLAVAAAFVFHNGYEEVAAVVWLASLILLLPNLRL